MRDLSERPDEWRVARLGEIATISTGGTPSRSNPRFWGGDIPWMASGEVNQRLVKSTAEHISREGLDESNARLFPEGTVMVALNGQGSTRGKTARLGIEAACNQSLAAVCACPGSDQGFLFQVLSSMYDGLRRLTGDGRSGLNLGLIRSISIRVPPLEQQRTIAAVLDAIDETIERTEAVISATKRLRDALLHELLTRGVRGWHMEWKEVPGVGAMPADWEVVGLGNVAEVKRGKFAHRPRNAPRFYGGETPFIQTGDVVRANGRIRQHSQTLNDLGLAISRLFPAETIIVTIAANIGETAIADYPVAFPDSLVGVTPHGIDTSFLEYFLRTQKGRLSRFAPESAQKNINLDDLRPLPTVLPSLPEQQAIAAVLDSVNEAIDCERGAREDLQSLKQSVLEGLLTGRVRVSALENNLQTV